MKTRNKVQWKHSVKGWKKRLRGKEGLLLFKRMSVWFEGAMWHLIIVCATPVPGDPTFFSGLHRFQKCMWYIDIHADKTLLHKYTRRSSYARPGWYNRSPISIWSLLWSGPLSPPKLQVPAWILDLCMGSSDNLCHKVSTDPSCSWTTDPDLASSSILTWLASLL